MRHYSVAMRRNLRRYSGAGDLMRYRTRLTPLGFHLLLTIPQPELV